MDDSMDSVPDKGTGITFTQAAVAVMDPSCNASEEVVVQCFRGVRMYPTG